MSAHTGRARLYFLDNVRWIMIARVAVFHVAAGYSALPEYYYETQAGGAIAMVRNIMQALPGMAVLFFVAGYFALPSLKRKSYSGFIAGKLFVLGIPYLLCIFFLGPMMPYLGYYSQSFNGLATDSYWSFWSTMLASGFGTEITPVVFTTNQQFHPMHFWFLSVLLQFFIVFALAHAAWSRWGRKGEPTHDTDTAPTEGKRVAVKTLCVAAVCMAAVSAAIGLLDLPSGLIFGILQFRPGALGTFGGFFALGVFAYSRGWFVQLKPPGWWAFGIFLVFAVSLGGFGIWLFTTMGDSLPSYIGRILYSVWMSAAGIWFLTVVIGLTYRYMNKPSAMNARLARVSYPVYLIHYPLILVFRLLLLDVDLPTVVKFLVVLGLAVSSSVFLGHYLLRPRPRAAAVVLVGVHILVLTFGLPQSSWSHELLERREELHAVIPEQRPRQITDAPEEELVAGFFTPPPMLSVSWQDSRLYAGMNNGLFTIGADGVSQELDADLVLGALAQRPGGGLFAIARNEIVTIDEDGRPTNAIVDSTDSPGALGHLASDAGGGLFFSGGSGDSSGVFYLAAVADIPVAVADVTNARGLALSADGRRLWVNAAGDYTVWVFDVGEEGVLTNQRAFAELFRADGRYGRNDLERSVDPAPEGMAADRNGGLYITSRSGLQVFSPEGQLLGVVNFPDVPLTFTGYPPRSCAFGGPEMSTLYVTCWQAVFALDTNAGG